MDCLTCAATTTAPGIQHGQAIEQQGVTRRHHVAGGPMQVGTVSEGQAGRLGLVGLRELGPDRGDDRRRMIAVRGRRGGEEEGKREESSSHFGN